MQWGFGGSFALTRVFPEAVCSRTGLEVLRGQAVRFVHVAVQYSAQCRAVDRKVPN